MQKVSAGGEPAATPDIPQLCPAPEMQFMGTQGYPEVSGYMVPRANPALAGSPGKGFHSHSFAHGRSDLSGHHCPSPSSPDLPDPTTTLLPAKAVCLHTHGWEAPGAMLCSPDLPTHWHLRLTSAVLLLGDAQACSRGFWLWCHLRELLQGQQHSQLNICTIFLV